MLKILTCFKWVIDEADIRVEAGSRRLLLDRAGYKISEYDRNAVEEAMRLEQSHGAAVAAVTVAGADARKCLKDVLSRGPAEAYFINDPEFSDLEPSQTAAILASAIASVPIEFDLIICGEGSSDLYTQQVGPMLAERLQIASATFVNRLDYDPDGGRIRVQRKLHDGIEQVEMPLPALVTILPDINTARIPSLKQVLSAARKPVHEIGAEQLGGLPAPCLETVSTLGATMDRRRQRFGAEAEDLLEVAKALAKDGVVS